MNSPFQSGLLINRFHFRNHLFFCILFIAGVFIPDRLIAQDIASKKVIAEKPSDKSLSDSVIYINGFQSEDINRKYLLMPADVTNQFYRDGIVRELPGSNSVNPQIKFNPDDMVILIDSPEGAAKLIRNYSLRQVQPDLLIGGSGVKALPSSIAGNETERLSEDRSILINEKYQKLLENGNTPEVELDISGLQEDAVKALPRSDEESHEEFSVRQSGKKVMDGLPGLASPSELEDAMPNLPPVAIPDVYITSKGEPLVVDDPGHLANDYDINGDALSWITYQLPSNGTVSETSTDGTFTYTPDPGFSGVDSFIVTISDGNGGIASGQIAILVKDNASPVAVPDVYTIPEGESLVVSAPGHLGNDSDPEGDPLEWISYTFPSSGTMSGTSSDGGFTYTPDAGFNGLETITISITDGNGNIAQGQLIILVKENLAPVAVPDVFSTAQGEPLVVTAPGHLANDYDPEGDPVEWISYTFPENGTVSGTSSDGGFTYTPNPGFSGLETLEIAITDGNGNIAFGEVNIQVIASDQRPPVALSDVFVTDEGQSLTVPAPGHLANDYDPDGDPLEWISYTFPSNGTMSGTTSDGGFTYTPNPGFTGHESITVTITDGNGNIASSELIITVVPLTGSAPVAIADAYSTPVGEALVVTAPGHLGNDYDPDGDPVEWISYTFPSNGTMTGTTSDGGFTYTPNPGFTGQESFDVTITDGNGNFDVGRIVITVIPSPELPPVAIPDVFITQQGQALTVSPPGHLANDYDPDGDPVEWISYTFPANGTVTGTTSDGGFTYTPNPGFSGIENLTVTITDGNGGIAVGQVTIFVEKNLPPVAVPDVYVTNQDEPLVIADPGHLANDYDPDGDPVEWISYTFPTLGTVTGTSSGGGFTYTPDPGVSGLETITVSITDGNGNVGSTQITILIKDNLPPVQVPDVFTTNQDQPLTIAAPGHLGNDTDPEGDPIEWISYTFPAIGTVTGTTSEGGFTYTPNSGATGVESLTVSITDGKGNVASGLVMIAVIPNFPPVANAGEDITVVAGQSVELDGSLSYDPEGETISYSWMFDAPDSGDPLPAGSGAALSGANSSAPSFTTDVPGEYIIQLVVNDGLYDSEPDYVQVTALSVIQALANLKADVLSLQAAGVLNKGRSRSLIRLIDQTAKLYEKNRVYGAVALLQVVRHQVEKLWFRGVLNASQATNLIDQVDVILSVMPSVWPRFSSEMSASIGEEEMPYYFELTGVYPNPVMTSSRIVFRLPEETLLNISLYDLSGRLARELVSDRMNAGTYEIEFNSSGLNNGTYLLIMTNESGAETEQKRIIINR